MFQLIIKGNNLQELKEQLKLINLELNYEGENTIDMLDKIKKTNHAEIMSSICNQPRIETVAELVKAVEEIEASKNFEESINISYVQGEVDSNNIPWDERIHSANKNKNADGSWRIKRGVDKTLLEQVTIQLRNRPVQPAPIAQPLQTVKPTLIAQPTPIVQPIHTVQPLSTIVSGHTIETFSTNFPLIMANLISSGKLTPEYCEQLKTHFGVKELWDFSFEHKQTIFDFFVENKIIVKV